LPRFFLQRWLEEMDSLLPNMSTKKWSEIVTYWAQNAEKKQADAISVDAYVVDTILEELSRCEVTTSLPMALNEHRYFYAKYRFEDGDKPQKVLYYANKHMKRLIDSTKYKVDLGRIRKLLHPYLAGDSVPIRHKEELNRFWQFKGDLLEIDWKTKFIPDEEEK
jgi:hypothetical protein